MIIRITILRAIESWICITHIRGIFVAWSTHHSVISWVCLITRIHFIHLIHRCWFCIISLHFLTPISIFLIRTLWRWGLTVLLVICLFSFWSFHFIRLTYFKSKIKIALFFVKATLFVNFSDFLQILFRKSFVKVEFILSKDLLPKKL